MPQFPAHAIVGRIFRIEADRSVAIGDRMPRIAFVLPCGRAPRVDLRPAGVELGRAPKGRKRVIALAGVQLRRFAAARSLVFIGCHENRCPCAPSLAHNTGITFATSFPTGARRDIDPRQPQRRDLIRRPMVPSAAAGIIFIASYVAPGAARSLAWRQWQMAVSGKPIPSTTCC